MQGHDVGANAEDAPADNAEDNAKDASEDDADDGGDNGVDNGADNGGTEGTPQEGEGRVRGRDGQRGDSDPVDDVTLGGIITGGTTMGGFKRAESWQREW